MNAGVPALANLLDDEGYAVEIVHLGIESEASEPEAKFSLRRYLDERGPRLVLLSLHWARQTRAVVTLAERIKRWRPEATVVLGGLTATVFAREIVETLPFIDVVVRGDGEEPLRRLAGALLRGDGPIDGVPNLVARDGGRVRETAWTWALDEAYASRLRHGSLRRLRHCDRYVSRALYADFAPGAPGSEGYAGAAYLNAGRGCTLRCPCCGGAAAGQRLTAARDGLVLYPLEKLGRDVREARAEGARVLRTSFDPPGARRRVAAWLRRLAADASGPGERLRVIYDLWTLPSAELLAALASSGLAGSTVVYSPECGSERVRRLLRPGGAFTNAALLRSIADATARGLGVHVFLSAGLPGETRAEVDETARLIERLRRTTSAGLSVLPMTVDPASPLWSEPERFGVRLVRRTLADFHDWGVGSRGLAGGPGYETEAFDEAAIVAEVERLQAIAREPSPSSTSHRPRP